MRNNKLYYVLPSDMAKQLDYGALEEQSYETVRHSIDRALCIVEYKGALAVRGGSFYTYDEALALMQTADWYDPNEDFLR
jgi:hypothetical protein